MDGSRASRKRPTSYLLWLYSRFMRVVAIDGAGIKSMADLKGRRVSTGAPVRNEIKALRVMEAYGLTPKDWKAQERLGASESPGTLKDGKVDACFGT